MSGDRILVRPGNYCEPIVIDKVVEIIGDGEVGDIVITASGSDTILFRSTMGRIANLTLRQTGGKDFACVDIAQGRLDMEACDISSQSFACVAIHDGADPRMRRNRIHDGQVGGILVHDNAQGTIEDNEIFSNDCLGVGICTGGAPTLRRNRIHDNTGPGVGVWSNGKGTVEDNDILGNEEAGVEIEEGGTPTIRRNRITGNGSAAVSVHDGGQGTVEDNDLRGNKGGAWDLEAECAGNVKRARNQE